ncbi:MAG: RidA family protein [Gemmatimonadaceae bacterium]|jgi:2-iminobutanoate/2-iminopropanoate deaminase|nr:RidA family protein [Gemmatimonadaceae bacterium]
MPHRFIEQGPGVPKSPAPISQAVVAGSHCYVSGQLAVGPDGSFVPGTAAEEAALAFRNVFAVLHAADFRVEDIVYIDLAFIDLADLPAVNALYADLFPDGARPARTVYQAAALPYGGRVKVQAVAIRGG